MATEYERQGNHGDGLRQSCPSVSDRITFHDLRAYYVTEGKERGIQVTEATGHKSDATANRIYDRRRVRKATPLE